ncbi:MAG: type III glutamate--ammonia ligase [Rhodobacteraceae bacterium]|nr:type III glutamate--ammonia ligase [Paracoccaceae bacterium]
MPTDLKKVAKEKGIRFFLISFTDLFGVTRSKLVPAAAIADAQADGAGFAGFAAHLDMSPADTDMFGLPDADYMIQLPWKPEVAWVPSDLFLGPDSVGHCPRTVLKKVLADGKDNGYSVLTGVECEFFLLNPDGTAVADEFDTRPKPCYDQQAVMRRYDFIAELSDHMETLGWGPYQNDHEDANGQFEQNWGPADALTTADRHVFYKYMVKTLAEQHGLRATFMPKPLPGLTGNGTHCHVSVWSKDGKTNLMKGDSQLGLSDLALNLAGGLLQNAAEMTLILNPIHNSYKRINAPRTTSGATWAPNTVTWSGNNRTHMIRVPADNRIECRLPDGAANPYLLQAAIAGAGLHGIMNKTDPGKRYDIDMYAEGHTVKDAPKLPLNMVDAMHLFEGSRTVPEFLGQELCDAYLKLKRIEWADFMHHFSDWERRNGLDV